MSMDKSIFRTLLNIVYLPLTVILCSCNSNSSSSGGKDFTATNLFANPSTNTPPAVLPQTGYPTQHSTSPTGTIDPDNRLLAEADKLDHEGNRDAALEKVAEVLKAYPRSVNGYLARGKIYSQMKKWAEAKEAFQAILEINADCPPAQFNLCELQFMQKQYDDARVGFEALEEDPDLGDLAAYKVFLCGLFAGHEDKAKKELDAFNANGSNPSYYFSNAAWDLYHKEPDDARVWLSRAQRIYYPYKLELYASSLIDLGYLPLSNVKNP
jgi:tetratricopeptide (TPR) repeat protein